MRLMICSLTAALLAGACASGSGDNGPAAGAAGSGGATSGGGGSNATGGSAGATAGAGGTKAATGGAGGTATGNGGASGAGGASDAGTRDTTSVDAGGNDGAGQPGDTAAAGAVTPVERNGRWVFEANGITFEVDPKIGGRVTGFGFGTQNLLTDATVNMENWGSTFWTSPQSVWGWPPPPQIDNQPYTVDSSAGALVLTGQQSPAIGVNVVKTFAMDRTDGSVKLTYKVTNQKTTMVSVAPWEVTRVANRGLVFFPTGPSTKLSPGATLPTTTTGNITWFSYNAAEITSDSKLFADALEGWMAYADADVLFIKKFADVPTAMLAPNQGDVEIYTNKLRSYIELENQGAYTPLAPQASLTWTVTWYLKRLPAGVMATAGNMALADLTRATVR